MGKRVILRMHVGCVMETDVFWGSSQRCSLQFERYLTLVIKSSSIVMRGKLRQQQFICSNCKSRQTYIHLSFVDAAPGPGNAALLTSRLIERWTWRPERFP